MTVVHSKSSRVYANEKAVSTTISGWTVGHTRNMGEKTVIVDEGARFVPGLMSGTLALRGPYDSVGEGLDAEIRSAWSSDNGLLVTVCPDTTAIGKPALIVSADPTEYTIDANVADVVGFTMNALPDEGVDMGFIAHAAGAETVDVNGTSVDRGVGSTTTNGAAASLHLTAYATLTSAAIKIQHSTDNSSWADLVAFTTATGLTFERKVVAAGTTVNRYVRVVTDVTGSGSATFLVAFAPR